MRYHSMIAAAGLLACFAGESVEADKTDPAMPVPAVIQDTGLYSAGDFAGDWQGYWFGGKRFLGRAASSFFLTEEGEWRVAVEEGEAKKAGTFQVSDGFLLFRPDSVEEGVILGRLLDRDNFILKAEGRELAVVYRRRSAIPVATHEQLKGKWRFYQEAKEGGERKESPFYLLFDGKGNFRYELIDRDFKLSPPLQGRYELSADLVTLSPGLNGGRQFLLAFDNLILNDAEHPSFGEKEK